MSRPKFIQAQKTTLKVAISASEVSEIVLNSLLDLYGNDLIAADFANDITFTFAPGSVNEEIVSCTGFTRNSDGTVSLDTGIVRGLEGVSTYSTGGTPRPHAAGTVVVISNNPQMYEAMLDYMDSLAIAGAADASLTGKGILEVGTAAEIDADTTNGATGAPLAVNPAQLALSKYGLYIPNANQKIYLNAVVGMISSYAGISAPSGFNLCDGSELTLASYPLLGAVVLGRYGYGTGVTFTVVAATDVITANNHGLLDTQKVLVKSTTTLPAGLSENTIYYVRDVTTNTFKLATSSGGTAIDITNTGTGTHSFYISFLVPNLKGRFPLGYSASAPTKVFTFASRASNIITVTGADNHANNEIQTGQAVLYTAASGAMTGLTHNTTYYLIRVTATTFSLASSQANAIAGTAIALSSDGTGTQTFTLSLTARSQGHSGGEEAHSLTIAEMPAHTHNNVTYVNSGSNGLGKANDVSGNKATDSTGGSTAHNIMPPFLVLNYIIKTD